MAKEDQATAYHEAAHATAAFEFNTKVRSISIVPDDKTLGRVQVRRPRWCRPDVEITPRIQCKVEAEIIGLLAAGHAEARICGRYNRRGAQHDQEQAADLATYVQADEAVRNLYLRYLDARAAAFIRDPRIWFVIKAVAEALLARRSLKGSEVEVLIREITNRYAARSGAE